MENPPKNARAYHRQIDDALGNGFLRRTLDKFAVEYRASRDLAFAEIDGDALIRRIAEVKDRCARDFESLYARFKAEAEKRGVVVHRAATAAEAREIVARIAAENGVRRIVKSKSMTAEEIGLNAHLERAGYEVQETDLGEWIVQLRKEGPSHMVLPAIHLSRGQVADEFEKATGEPQDHEDVQKLVKVARRELRPKFLAADMGVSGANFCIAETGALAIVTNEGNGCLVNTLPGVHVALAGIDKLVPTIEDVLSALRVLPRNATGQRITSYVTFIDGAGPSKKSPTGRKIMHVVFLDNGRSAIAKDPLFAQLFRCVRCGACANVCPVFRMVGGRRMGHVYVGAIGLVLTWLFHDRQVAKTLCQNCIGCGSCKQVCSGGIDLPELVREIRARFAREEGKPLVNGIASLALRNRSVFHALLKFARFSQRPVAGKDGFVRHLPEFLLGRQGFRSIPALAPQSFREWWASRTGLPAVPMDAAPRLRVALFAGCAGDFVLPHQLRAGVKVLEACGVEVVFPMEQTCCGLPLSQLGEKASAEAVARQNVRAFAAVECDAVVTLCASCASHLKHWYAKLPDPEAKAFAAKTWDFSSFVHDRLDLARHAFSPSTERTAYHASCHLCRALGGADKARALLRAASAYVPAREEETCCGFGGSYSVKFPEISAELLKRKLDGVVETGASRVALDCPGCAMQIAGGADKRGAPIKVVHVAEVLAESF
ncbi:MAG: LUD domain-containing protein [Kiritimatiellae bacterium]|nr:LUD domain-containing protein [Kiritimatiellia bacterium]